MSACKIASSKAVIVVGDDTDLLILLLHHYSHEQHSDIYLQSSTKLVSIPILQETIGDNMAFAFYACIDRM